MSLDQNKRIVQINSKDITPVELMEHLRKSEELIFKTLRYFFSSERFSVNAPFKGFLVYGPVGTGKTELVRQVARRMGQEFKDVRLVPIDSSVIASPRWGESEQILQSLFSMVKDVDVVDKKVILFFDDLESLLLARGMQAAREWHYSLNAVFFHLVDSMNPFRTVAIATTNRSDLLDAAITTRLYPITVTNVTKDQLLRYAEQMIDSMIGNSPQKKRVMSEIEGKLLQLNSPTIRDARQIAIVSCIENDALV